MSETRYCILCGEPFETGAPEAVFCPDHGGKAPAKPGGERGDGVEPPVDSQRKVVSTTPGMIADWNPGDLILDTYKVNGVLGKGGFGAVYRVHHQGWNMDLAVKRALNLDEENKQDFIDEAQHWIDLGLHPHIISCYYVRNIDGFPHTFAELAEGGSLHDWIREEQGNLYQGNEQEIIARILDIAIQFAWGLGYAHQQGLLHGDVKPQNALMTPEGVLKVTDFGLARAGRGTNGADAGEPTPHKIIYSPYHCSPEQRMGKPLTQTTDVWSWGVSVLEMFNGGISWMGGQVAASALESYLQRAGEEDDIPPMPGAVAELLRDCFQEDPQDRPKDMLKIAEWLIKIYQDEIGHAYFREMPKAVDLRADSLNNKALSMLEMGDDQRALEDWELAIKHDSLHVEATYNLGLYRWRAGLQSSSELENKLSAINAAKPDDSLAAYLLALVYLEKGNVESAEEILEQAEAQSSANDEIQTARSLLESITIEVGEEIFKEQQYGVADIAISHKNQLVYSIDDRFNLYLWNDHDLTFVKMYDLSSVKNPDEISGYPKMVLLEDDHHVLVTGYPDFSFKHWDTRTGNCVRSYQGHTGEVIDIDVDPKRLQIVSGGYDQMIRIWDLKTGICTRSIETEYANNFIVRFTLDGDLIINGSDGGYNSGDLKVYGLDPFREKHVLEGHDGEVYGVDLTPDGTKMLSGGHDSNAILWDLVQGQQITPLLDNDDYATRSYVWTVAISPDGNLALVGDEFGKLEVWDLKRLSLQRFLQGHDDAIMAIAFSPDGQSVLVSSRDTNLRHDLSAVYRYPAQWALCIARSAQQEEETINEANRILGQARSALSQHDFLAVKRLINQLREIAGYEWHQEAFEIWQEVGITAGRRSGLLAFRKLRTLENFHDGPIKISHDGKTAIAGNHNSLKLVNLEKAEFVQEFRINGKDIIKSVDISGGFGLSGSESGCVEIWDLDQGQRRSLLKENDSGIYWVSFLGSGDSVIFAREDGSVNLWQWKENPNSSIQITQLAEGAKLSAFDDVKFHAAINIEGHELILMDLEHHNVIDHIGRSSFHEYDGRLHAISEVVISPDRNKLFFENNHPPVNQTGIWDMANHYYSEYLIDHGGKVAFSPDGWFLAVSRFYWPEEAYQAPKGTLEMIKIQNPAEMMTHADLSAHNTNNEFSKSLLNDEDIVVKEVILENDVVEIEPLSFSVDGRYLFATREKDLQVWELFWDYEFPEPADWDEGACPYLESFLTLHTPDAEKLSQECESSEEEIKRFLTRQGMPNWTEEDFQGLLTELGYRGYGWLREKGVRRKLEEMTKERG
jgi:WD40 repeat protein/serine/threonine protein kinase